jgi:hypothetical protein
MKINKKYLLSGLVTCSGADCSICHFLQTLEQIFFWLLSTVFAAAILLTVIAGIAYLSATGNQKLLNQAKKWLFYTLFGFAICLLSWLLTHFLYATLGYRGNWWQMECGDEGLGAVSISEQANLYANEMPVNEPGGRNKPISLPDLSVDGLAWLPENQYFFIHGLGGQPLDQAAEQLAKIIKEAKSRGKTVYAVIPYKNPDTGEIEGFNLINLNQYLGSDQANTLENLKGAVIRLITESPVSNFPIIVADTKTELAKFNNLWPEEIKLDKALVTAANGVVYSEKEINTRGEEDSPYNSYFTINLTYDPKSRGYSLNRDDPITFDFPPEVEPIVAESAVIEIAKVVAEATKNSKNMSKDEWDGIADLIAKNPKFLAGFSGDSDYAYTSGAFPSGVVMSKKMDKNWGVNNPQLDNHDKIIQELEAIAKSIVDDKLGSNTSIVKKPTGGTATVKNPTPPSQESPEIVDAIPTYPTSPSTTRQGGATNPTSPISNPDPGDLIAPPIKNPSPGSRLPSGGQTPSTSQGTTPSIFESRPTTQDLVDSFNNKYTGQPSPTPSDQSQNTQQPIASLQPNDLDLVSPERTQPGNTDVDFSKYSSIKGKVAGERLNLEQREEQYKLAKAVETEMAETAMKMNEGKILKKGESYDIFSNFDAGSVMMCIEARESRFKPGSNWTGGMGLGQLTGRGKTNAAGEKVSSLVGAEYLKKFAPKTYQALSEKVKRETGEDMDEILMDSNAGKKKEKLLTTDPYINTAVSMALLDSKRRNSSGVGRPLTNKSGVESIMNSYYGQAGSDYPNRGIGEVIKTGKNGKSYKGTVSVIDCVGNNAWRYSDIPPTAIASNR